MECGSSSTHSWLKPSPEQMVLPGSLWRSAIFSSVLLPTTMLQIQGAALQTGPLNPIVALLATTVGSHSPGSLHNTFLDFLYEGIEYIPYV